MRILGNSTHTFQRCGGCNLQCCFCLEENRFTIRGGAAYGSRWAMTHPNPKKNHFLQVYLHIRIWNYLIYIICCDKDNISLMSSSGFRDMFFTFLFAVRLLSAILFYFLCFFFKDLLKNIEQIVTSVPDFAPRCHIGL